jgi:hypothetical protein
LLGLAAAGVRLRVDGLADLHGGGLESLDGLSDLVGVLGSDGLVFVFDVSINLVLDILWDLVGVLLQLSLGVVDSLVSLVLEVDHLSSLAVSFLGSLGVVYHPLDVGIGQTSA